MGFWGSNGVKGEGGNREVKGIEEQNIRLPKGKDKEGIERKPPHSQQKGGG